MPLHKIPLCNFKYVGDTIFASATFKYDTAVKIFKTKEKLFYKKTIVEIDKVKGNKLFYKGIKSIEREKNKYLNKKFININKESEKELRLNDREINKTKDIYLNKKRDININVENNKELEAVEDINIYIENNKRILNRELLHLNKNIKIINVFRDREKLGLSKYTNLYVNKSVEKKIFKEQLLQNLKLEKKINIGKHKNNYFDRSYEKKIYTDKLKLFEKHKIKDIYLYKHRYIDRINLKEIDTPSSLAMLRKDVIRHINVDSSSSNLNILGIKIIDKIGITVLMHNIVLRNIEKYEANNELNKIADKEICKDNNKKYFYREGIKTIDKYNNRYLSRSFIKFIFKYNNIYMGRECIVNIFKNTDKSLGNNPIINIYKQVGKDLLNISIWDIYKEYDKYLKGETIKEIYKVGNNNQFIEIIKRWWFLNPTEPIDKLIIPNKDFNYGANLLNNLYYEYLRFTNHPIEWGKEWDIDWNTLPMPVSIEIMLDLINILMVIWHKNTQGWLYCSGKEAMQFVMELLYDWYTMDTSRPNIDYIRAYRWIRWEAEKVYFLNTENGLQAIGMLIANLIDYMKQHHFDLIPIWRNPKAMDIERNFNRIAQNGDIIKSLDKLKGNRHYMIETQNFEKKNIFGGR